MREEKPVGIRLFVEVLDHAPDTLTWRERYALGVLAENANDATRECWPGIEDDPVIAHRMRLPGRSSRYEVMKSLREKKALEGVSAGRRGHRAVYRIPEMGPAKGPGIPDANGDTGSGDSGHSVRDPQTQTEGKGPENPDPMNEKGSGNDPNRVREPHGKGPGNPDPSPSDSSVPSSKPASKQAGAHRQSSPIPDFARPLVDQITAAGVHVRWGFSEQEWFQVHAVIKKSGIPSMAAVAVKAARRADVESARYFLPGWRELAPQPTPGTQRPRLHSVGPQTAPEDLTDEEMTDALRFGAR
ncbi:hypothetical protein [Streptomyces asiaticus]|uniref:hypothetical protein n=1 Tax=Streptomyces asiaticus TaxID=114695 RepID=UPI003F66D010